MNRESLSSYFKLVGRKSFKWLMISALAGLGLALVELIFASSLQKLMHIIGTSASAGDQSVSSSLASIVAMLIGVGFLRAAFLFLVNHGSGVALENLSSRLRILSIYELLLLRQHEFQAASTMVHRHTEMFPKAGYFVSCIMQMLPNIVQMMVICALMIYFAPMEALLGFGCLGLIGLLSLLLQRNIHALASRIPQEHRELLQGIERISNNWLLVRLLKTSDREFSRLSNNVKEYSYRVVESNRFRSIAATLPQGLGIAVILAIIYCSKTYFDTTGPSLLAFLYLFLRFIQNLSSAVNLSGLILEMQPSFMEASRYISRFSTADMGFVDHSLTLPRKSHEEIEAELRASSTLKPNSHVPPPPNLAVKDLSFSYENNRSERPVIQNLNLEVPPGLQMGIIGPSGCGKSTLLQLILGLLKPDSGSVSFDGESSLSYIEQCHERIGFVGADPFMLGGSVRQNLEYGLKHRPSDEEIWESLRLAEMDDVIRKTPAQLESIIKENGDGFSAGQKQRLSLARALLRKPSFLILDEATANLDERTESFITETIRNLKGHTTVLIVSHRPGILKHADRVLVLPKGEIRYGTPEV